MEIRYGRDSLGSFLRRFTVAAACALLAALAQEAGATCGTSAAAAAGVTTIQSAVNAAPATLTAGDHCVSIGAGTYAEQVTVRNINPNGFRIVISSAPGAAVTVSPPAASTGAFLIQNASVTIQGIHVLSANPIPYGIQASSAYVTLSSVSVDGANLKINFAAIAISSWSTVVHSSVTMLTATGITVRGLHIQGTGSTIAFSTIASRSSVGAIRVVHFDGAVGNTVTRSFIYFGAGGISGGHFGAYLDKGAHSNTISFSTITSSDGGWGLYLSQASSNTFTDNFVGGASGIGLVDLSPGSHFNSFFRSTMTSGNGGDSFILWYASFTTLSDLNLTNPSGGPLYFLSMEKGTSLTVLRSTITCAGGCFTSVYLSNIASATFTDSYLEGQNGPVLLISNGSSMTISGVKIHALNGKALSVTSLNDSVIDRSTMTCVATAGGSCVEMSNSQRNMLSRSLITSGDSNGTGTALTIGDSLFNTISESTVTITVGSRSALLLEDSSSNTITRSYLASTDPSCPGGCSAIYMRSLATGSNGNTLSLSTVTSSEPGGESALVIESSSFNVISQSFLWAPPGPAGMIYGGYANQIVDSHAKGAGASFCVFNIYGLGFNVIARSKLENTVGGSLCFQGGTQGNTIVLSTLTGVSSNFGAVYFDGSLGALERNLIQHSYIQGSTGVYISAAGGQFNALNSNVIVATGAASNGVWVSAAANLLISSNTIRAGSLGAGIYLSPGSAGLYLSTNTISLGQYGIFVGTQNPPVWIASNTVIPAISSARNTYGIYLNGLTTGATIHNNAIVYRSSGSMGSFRTCGIYGQSSKGLVIERNRISNPGMVTGGGIEAVYFTDVDNTWVKFNDLHSTGTALADGYLLRLAGGSTGVQVKNNVFSSSMAVSGSSATLGVSADSQPGFASNYNDFFSYNSANTGLWGSTAYQFPTAWSAGTGQDANSISAQPLWHDSSSGVEDFHPMSVAGRFDPAAGTYVADSTSSLTIDAADPAEPFALEPPANGSRANLGSYGNTAQASKTPAPLGLGKPGTPAGTALGVSSISWTWSAAVGATSYRVYLSSSPTTLMGAVSAPPFIQTGLAANTDTGIVVSGVNGSGEGVVSGSGLATTLASASAALSSVRAAISAPDSGALVGSNSTSLTVAAKLVAGGTGSVDKVLFQYQPSTSTTWSDIPALNPAADPNPTRVSPYSVSWNVSGLAAGDYRLRAVAYDQSGSSDSAPGAVSFTLVSPAFANTVGYTSESLAAGVVTKTQVLDTSVTPAQIVASGVATDGSPQDLTLDLPAGCFNDGNVTVTVVPNPSAGNIPPLGAADGAFAGTAAQITLSAGDALVAPATIVMSYPDADSNGVIDGTTFRFDQVKVLSNDGAGGGWKQDVTTTVDSASRRITSVTSHFSFFALAGVAAADLSSVRVFPVPYKPNSGDANDGVPFNAADGNSGIIFDNLPASVTVKIYSISGALLEEFSTTSGTGKIQWDTRNRSGKDVASGWYFAVITSPGHKTVTKRLAIIR